MSGTYSVPSPRLEILLKQELFLYAFLYALRYNTNSDFAGMAASVLMRET